MGLSFELNLIKIIKLIYFVQLCPILSFKPNRIKKYGYPAEVHTVQTEDGYILRLHRIPYGRKSPRTDEPRPPVLLMHGFLESSNGWTVLGADNSLPYLLGEQHKCNRNEFIF